MEFVEKDCTITVDGKQFTSGGSFMATDRNGKLYGVVYGDFNAPDFRHNGYTTTWHSDKKFRTLYGKVYRGNMGDSRRHVTVFYNNKKLHGLWARIDFNQLIRVRER